MAKVSLTKVNTDSNIMLAFLNRLAFTLSVEDSQRRKNTVLLLDSASYHTSAETRLNFVKIGLTYCLLRLIITILVQLSYFLLISRGKK